LLSPVRDFVHSFKVHTGILGIELDSTFASAHSKRDSLGQHSARPFDAASEAARQAEGEQKVSLQLAKADYGSVFVNGDKKGRITISPLISGLERRCRSKKMGHLEKAPVLTDRVVA
jgi:hypothetical protein